MKIGCLPNSRAQLSETMAQPSDKMLHDRSGSSALLWNTVVFDLTVTHATYSVLLCSFDLTILPSAVLPVPKCYQQLAAIDFQPRAADYRLEVLLEACRSSRLNFNSDSAA